MSSIMNILQNIVKEDEKAEEEAIMKIVVNVSRIEPNDADDNVETKSNKKNDPNRQGYIRNVKSAHLVYKRQNEEESYNELWMWSIKDSGMHNEEKIKKDILSGTDIPINKSSSEDGEQTFNLWNIGNVGFMEIFNLPA